MSSCVAQATCTGADLIMRTQDEKVGEEVSEAAYTSDGCGIRPNCVSSETWS